MFILDVLKYDIEPLESILNLLNDRDGIGWRNFWPRDFLSDEVLSALAELIKGGMVKVLRYDELETSLVDSVDYRANLFQHPEQFWFALTDKGTKTLENWDDFPRE
jgi:hypothetical protein